MMENALKTAKLNSSTPQVESSTPLNTHNQANTFLDVLFVLNTSSRLFTIIFTVNRPVETRFVR